MSKLIFSKVINIVFYIFLIIILFGFIKNNESRFIMNLIFIFIFYILLSFIERKILSMIPNFIRILLMITILLHLIFGQYFYLYYTTKWFDNLLHIIGAFSFSLFYYYISTIIFKNLPSSRMFTFTFIVLLGINGGTFFEILEFILDIIFNTNNQHGLLDTNLDIIFNIVGSILSGVFMVIEISLDNKK